MGKLTDKVAIITGGSGGIGKKTAELFLEEGAKVVLVDISGDALQKAAEELNASDRVFTVEADVTKEEDTKRYVSATIDKFGQLDVFFNNAGIEGEIKALVDQTLEDFERVIKVNLTGQFLGLKYVLPILTKQGNGSVINTASVAGLDGSSFLAPYVASKHGVSGLTKAAALEVADKGVRVNSVHPSPVNTRMMRSIEKNLNPDDAEKAKEEFTKDIPVGRYAEASDVAKLVLFLASDDSKFITGAQYRVDGGMGATQ
ncbi:SDR family NAD(P)-dependent oxidoreductase [Listeria grayi]|uniref:SDR family NAD(P)-dependent oxidoreductase n=1 Tax=Listeria grayi TaxID=1641 RepID=UPI0002EB2FCD|nr:SDR family NAD(P)-dependent oxidoreductase [Listeria grayi]